MISKNLTISEAKKQIRKGTLSISDLVGHNLENISNNDKRLNSFITVLAKEAIVEANHKDSQLRRDKSLLDKKPLFGIPFALKDIFCTRGVRTTAGSKLLDDFVPIYNSTVVQRLIEAGAIIIGKTNLDAWAHGSSGENSDFGPTKNPYDLSCVPGGSSSGSAVSVAAGMALAATGTDTGGSIRLPASFCNVVGLKPTYGRVSRYGVIAMASSFDSIGHFTNSVEDSALILTVTAGIDGKDATMPDQKVPDYTNNISLEKKAIKKIKIGLPDDYFIGVNPQITQAVLAKVKSLEKLGIGVEKVQLPYSKYSLAVYYIIQPAEVSSNLARFDGIRFGQSRDCFGQEAKRRIILGTFTLSSGYYDAYYLKATKIRTLICQDFKNVFSKVDALIAPVSPDLPFKIGQKSNDPLKMYLSDILTVPMNMAGLPSLAVPAGFCGKMPVGLQIIGPQFSEELLFKLGSLIENC